MEIVAGAEPRRDRGNRTMTRAALAIVVVALAAAPPAAEAQTAANWNFTET